MAQCPGQMFHHCAAIELTLTVTIGSGLRKRMKRGGKDLEMGQFYYSLMSVTNGLSARIGWNWERVHVQR